jgi:hypothetical protein
MTFHHVHGDLKKGMRDLLKTFAEMDKVPHVNVCNGDSLCTWHWTLAGFAAPIFLS